MSELENLKSRQQELLDKIQEIEEQCEGIGNEHNAQKVQELNKMQAQLMGNQNNLKQQLQSVQEKLKTINSEIDKLSSTATDRILEAIKNQRWYFFKNKKHILMDKTTGILWANLDYFPWNQGSSYMGNYTVDEANALLKNYIIDYFPNWLLPNEKDLIYIMNESCPFYNTHDFHKGRFWIIKEGYAIDFTNGSYTTGRLIPCNYSLIQDSEYEKNISEDNNIYTEKERLQFTLDLFRENELLPIFKNNEITDLYKKIYFEKPRLLQALNEVETQLAQCEEVKTITANFDYTTLLNKYDIASIDKSIIKYYEAVQQWIDELMEYLADFEQQKENVIQESNKQLSIIEETDIYKIRRYLTEEELDLYIKGRTTLQDKLTLDLGINKVKENLLKVKQQANDLEDDINRINDNNYAIYELAKLEKRKRARFELIAENTVKMVNKALQKIAFFEYNQGFIIKAVEVWSKWNEDYKVFKTKQFEELKHSYEEDDIEETVLKKWYEDWQKLRFTIEEQLQLMIERGLKGDIETKEEQETPIIMQVIYILNDYKISINNFYLEERRKIYEQYKNQKYSDLQEEFEVEKELYARTVNLQKALQNIIFNCKKEADKIFILRWIDNLIDMSINEIIQIMTYYKTHYELEQISQEVLNEFAKLKQKNYYMYLSDIKTYNQKLDNQEKQYNSLISRMKKSLVEE